MSAQHTPGPRHKQSRVYGPTSRLDHPELALAAKIIEKAIAAHVEGGDLWMCCAMAAQEILGEIAQEARHRFTGCPAGPWKRMPPSLRAAITRSTGAAS